MEVAQHFCFCVVTVEDFLLQVEGGPSCVVGEVWLFIIDEAGELVEITAEDFVEFR